MANINGTTVLIYVKSSDGTSDILIGGQTELSINSSRAEIENTTKDDTYKSLLGTARESGSVSINCYFDAADAGQDRVRTLLGSGAQITLARYDSGASTDEVTGYVTEYSATYPDDGVATVSMTVALEGDISGIM